MAKHGVAELDGALLDLAVAIAEGDADMARGGFSPSKRWHDAGPIIERERIDLCFSAGTRPGGGQIGVEAWMQFGQYGRTHHFGFTALEAAMRAYVSSKFGPEVELNDA